jgi:hypothetical protein
MTFFVNAFGWIDVGYNDESPVTFFTQAVDPGGMMWRLLLESFSIMTTHAARPMTTTET